METIYQIRVRGHLDRNWSEWFGGLQIEHDPCGDTTLTGLVGDQAALYGLITKARDLGLSLVSVNPVSQPDLQEISSLGGSFTNNQESSK